MSSVMQNSGVAMMLKAMGFDPQMLMAKAAELESMGKLLAAELHSKVTLMESRISKIEGTLETRVSNLEAQLGRMESLLTAIQAALGANLTVVSRLESSQAGTTPAGDTYDPYTVNLKP